MSPSNSEPATESRSGDADESVPPWPERDPEIAAHDTTDEAEDAELADEEAEAAAATDEAEATGAEATLPPPDREPIPLPGPDPAPPPEPDPEPGLVAQDEGSPDLELPPHEQPEVLDATVDDVEVDVEVDLETADDEYLDDLVGAEDDDLDRADADVALTAGPAAVADDETETGSGGEPDLDAWERAAPGPPLATEGRPLLADAGVWEGRWTSVQAGFVDDPGQAIQQADRLVTEAMEELARVLLAKRETLQERWRTADPPPDTEQLRVTVQGYRALLFGLLST